MFYPNWKNREFVLVLFSSSKVGKFKLWVPSANVKETCEKRVLSHPQPSTDHQRLASSMTNCTESASDKSFPGDLDLG